MTEITAIKSLLYPVKHPKPGGPKPRYMVDPVAFFTAMVSGPLLVGVIGAPTLIAPMATVMGGPIYLCFGVPVMLIYLRYNKASTGRWAALALYTHWAIFIPLLLAHLVMGGRAEPVPFFLVFGSLFAPLWGAISGAIYHWLEKDFYKQTT